jgi:hypothetical protein
LAESGANQPHGRLLSFPLAVQHLQKRLQVALRRRHPEFGPPHPKARDCVIAFGLRQNPFGCRDIDNSGQSRPIANLLLLFADLRGC